MTAASNVAPRSALLAPVGTAAGLGLAVLGLHLRDPHRHGSWGLCPFQVLTGWDCPGCGGLRAVHDLSNGSVSAAWHSNAVLVAFVPVLLVGWVLWLLRASGRRVVVPRVGRRSFWVALAVVVLVAFAVLRNTPWGQPYAA
ncbi:hypothetical protein ABIE44_000274 [Marmoricola sp. OAE513]|uniref:DUF2752 domain-containing protein n=1 Tax=Marmoricola sp. OAE513 TaxID=2817894 RepID=UPI001AE8ED95